MKGVGEPIDWPIYVVLAIAIVVTLVWGIATLIAAAFPSHPISPDLNLVMGGTVTAAFGLVGILVARREHQDD